MEISMEPQDQLRVRYKGKLFVLNGDRDGLWLSCPGYYIHALPIADYEQGSLVIADQLLLGVGKKED